MNHPAIDTPTDVSALTMELLPSGMKLYRVQQGTGDLPTAGQGVFLHAVGWESQGSKRKLFSSWDRGKPYLFSSSKLSDPYTTDIMQILQGLPVGSVIQLELPTDARIKKFDYILIQPMPVIIEIVVAKLYSANAPLPPP